MTSYGFVQQALAFLNQHQGNITSTLELKCQKDKPHEYPPRALPTALLLSLVDKELYCPKEYTSQVVLDNDRNMKAGGWADSPDTKLEIVGERTTFIDGGKRMSVADAAAKGVLKLTHDRYCLAISTGITGRGLLGLWGPNQAADAIVTKIDETDGKKRLMVAVQNRASGHVAFPGGMVDDKEHVSRTVRREFFEEQAKEDPLVAGMFDKGGTVVYRGFVDDERNTDNAWMETTAIHFHASKDIADSIVFEVSDPEEGTYHPRWELTAADRNS